jgi:hypothetical protein
MAVMAVMAVLVATGGLVVMDKRGRDEKYSFSCKSHFFGVE